jgi:hypothetical protein
MSIRFSRLATGLLVVAALVLMSNYSSAIADLGGGSVRLTGCE